MGQGERRASAWDRNYDIGQQTGATTSWTLCKDQHSRQTGAAKGRAIRDHRKVQLIGLLDSVPLQ